jgi:hypothetical protein
MNLTIHYATNSHLSLSKLSRAGGWILLAMQTIKEQDITSVSLAARILNVPSSNFRDRISGWTERGILRINSHKLIKIKEESL